MKDTGFEQLGFKPEGNQIVLVFNNNDLLALNSPYAERKPESKIVKEKKKSIISVDGKPIQNKKPDLYLGKEHEEAEAERKKNNRTFTIAAISDIIATKEHGPSVGDEVSLKAGNLTEIVVNDVVYGVIDAHRVLCIHKEKIDFNLDE